MSWLVLFTLTLLAAAGALSLASRHGGDGRAEAWVITLLSFLALVGGPVLILGYLGGLTRLPLALLSIAASTSALWLGKGSCTPEDHARSIRQLACGMLRMPLDAVRTAVVERSWVAVLLVATAFAILGSGVVTYLAPSESWDGLFYHEPIVGFAIQNHAFGMVNLPRQMILQGINGYPRFCESVALWFVIFTDRSLIEIGNTLAAPGLVLALYCLVKRYGSSRTTNMGWAACLLLMPSMLTQLRTTMIDVETTFFLLAAIHFVSRAPFRRADAIAAIGAITLAAASKSTGLVWGPPLLIVLVMRLFRTRSSVGRPANTALAVGGVALFMGVESVTLLRNWLAFGDPLWPITFRLSRLGIDWTGVATLDELSPTPPWREVLASKFGAPTEGIGDVIARDYGYAVPWVVLPIALVALGVSLSGRLRAKPRAPRADDSGSFLILAALAIAFVVVTPSYSVARYNAHIVGLGIVAVARALRSTPWRRLEEGALAAAIWLSIVPWTWNGWLFGVDLTVRDIGRMVLASHDARGSMNVARFGMPASTAALRDAELGPGDVVVFTQEVWFPGSLWNSHMSNRVVHVAFGDGDSWLENVEHRHAKWIVVGSRSAARKALEAHPDRYGLIGVAAAEDRTVAFRRLP